MFQFQVNKMKWKQDKKRKKENQTFLFVLYIHQVFGN